MSEERRVVFKLAVEGDSKNSEAFKKLGDETKKTDDSLRASGERAARERSKARDREAKEGAESAKRLGAEDSKSTRKATDDIEKSLRDRTKARLDAEKAAANAAKESERALSQSVGSAKQSIASTTGAIRALAASWKDSEGQTGKSLQALGQTSEAIAIGAQAVEGLSGAWKVITGLILASSAATATNTATTTAGSSAKAAGYELERKALERLNNQKNPGSSSGFVVNSTAPGAGAAGGASKLGTAGLGVAAIVAAGAALTVLAEAATGAANAENSLTQTIAGVEVSLTKSLIEKLPSGIQSLVAKLPTFVGETARAVLGAKAVEEAKKRREELAGFNVRRDLLGEQNAKLALAGNADAEKRIDLERGLAVGTKQALRGIEDAIQQNLASLVKTRRGLDSAQGDDARKRFEEEIGRLTERRVELIREASRIERESISEQRAANEEKIRTAKDEIRLSQERARTEADRLRSAAERFAAFDPLKQSKAFAAIAKARAGGELSDSQRSLLRSIGTTETTRFASAADIREASQAGFFRAFGFEEQRNIAAENSRQRRLEVEIADRRQIVANLQVDEDRIIASVKQTVDEVWQRQEARILARMKTEVEAARREIALQSNAQLGARRNLSGGR